MKTETLAQTHMQGPVDVNGSGKPLTKEELEGVKEELEAIKAEFGLKEPTRSFMDDPGTKWYVATKQKQKIRKTLTKQRR